MNRYKTFSKSFGKQIVMILVSLDTFHSLVSKDIEIIARKPHKSPVSALIKGEGMTG